MIFDSRKFVKTAAAGTIAGLFIPDIVSAAIAPKTKKITLEKDSVILFQGDSITDGGRDKDNNYPNDFSALGHGYPLLAASKLLHAYPSKIYRSTTRESAATKYFSWPTAGILTALI